MAYLDKHSTLDLVMASVVSSNPSGWRQLFAFDVNSGLKCKYDLIMKNFIVIVPVRRKTTVTGCNYSINVSEELGICFQCF